MPQEVSLLMSYVIVSLSYTLSLYLSPHYITYLVTHFCLGNHEADLPLNTIHKRIKQFSKSAKFVNTNVRNGVGDSRAWLSDASLSHGTF